VIATCLNGSNITLEKKERERILIGLCMSLGCA